MSASGALIRASYAKTVIGGIKRLPDRERDALLKGIGDELRGEIRNYGMLEWMSAARRAGARHCTNRRRRWCEAFLAREPAAQSRAPLAQPTAPRRDRDLRQQPALAAQDDTASLELVTRDGGTCHIEDRPPNSIVLRFEALPRELCDPALHLLWSGGSESCIERMGFTGSASAAVGASANSVDITVNWAPR